MKFLYWQRTFHNNIRCNPIFLKLPVILHLHRLLFTTPTDFNIRSLKRISILLHNLVAISFFTFNLPIRTYLETLLFQPNITTCVKNSTLKLLTEKRALCFQSFKVLPLRSFTHDVCLILIVVSQQAFYSLVCVPESDSCHHDIERNVFVLWYLFPFTVLIFVFLSNDWGIYPCVIMYQFCS